MAIYQVIVRLARNLGFPDGDNNQGYAMIVPLNADDRLDPAEWRQHRNACKIVRFKPGKESDADGLLTHKGGSWLFHYDEPGEGDDESVYRLGDHRLAMGDYLTIREPDGQSLTYKVTQRTLIQASNGVSTQSRAAR